MRVLWMMLAVAACGGQEGGAAPSRNRTGISWEADVRRAHGAPSSIIEYARAAADFSAQVIEAASRAAGDAPRTFGTVRETSNGVTYAPMPADRLIAERANGRRFELSVSDLAGTGGDAASFFRENHRIRIQFLNGFELEGEVWSMRQGTQRELGVRGRLTLEENSWNVDLVRRGLETFDVDQSGSRLFDDHVLVGELDNERIEMDVDERWTFELVTARDVGSSMSAANSVVRVLKDAARIGGERFAWEDVRIQRAFRDGKPSELDTFWRASGQITRDGMSIGPIEKFATTIDEAGGFVGLRIMTAGGPIELERYQAY